MSDELTGRVSIVTGGARGLGRGIALAFARAGARVVVADTDLGGAEETVELLSSQGGDGQAIRADVTSQSDVDGLVDEVVKRWGRLDCACNNAGTADGVQNWLDLTETEWSNVWQLNVTGVWLCMRAELRQMVEQNHGAIVNIGSIFGLVGSPSSPALTATKHAVVGLTKSAALAYADQGVRVNVVCPGFVDSPVLDQLYESHPGSKDMVVNLQPMRRVGTQREVGETVVWLCTEGAGFITGQAVSTDGGYTAQ